MNLQELAIRTVVLRRLQEQISRAYDNAKQELAKELGPEGRKVAELDGHRLATTWVTKRRVQIRTELLLPWVEELYPDEIITEMVPAVVKTSVRDSFVEAIRRATERAGEPCGPGGELDIPGVSLADGYLSVRAAPGADDSISYLWSRGRLGRIDLSTERVLEDGQDPRPDGPGDGEHPSG